MEDTKDVTEEIKNLTIDTIPEVDVETDSKEFLDKKMKEPIYIEGNEVPKIYYDQTFNLYKEDKEYWDVILIKVDTFYQNFDYFYYFIELMENKKLNKYIVMTNYYKEDKHEFFEFNNLDEAKNKFKEIFKEQTGNIWEEKNNFKHKKGKYMLYIQKKVKYKIKEFLEPFDFDTKSIMIKDENILDLFKNIIDISKIESAYEYIDINPDIVSFSILTKDIIEKAKNILLDIVDKYKEIEEIKKIDINYSDEDLDKNDGNDENIDTYEEKEIEYKNKEIKNYKDMENAIKSKCYKIIELSKKFFDILPRQKQFQPMPVASLTHAKNVFQTIVYLTNIEKSVKIFLAANNKINKIHPLDYFYYSFQTLFESISEESPIYKIIQKYIYASCPSNKLLNLISITRKEETKPRKAFDDLPNHCLLFHGTGITNLIGIFSNGLNIPNTPFPHSANVYGRGIYFTSMCSRSSTYSESIKDNINPNKKYFYILLCEVALGKMYHKDHDIDYEKLEFLKEGYNSLKSISQKGPDPSQNYICKDGMIIPCGNIIPYKNESPLKSQVPEYIIYNSNQIKLRYIAKLERE